MKSIFLSIAICFFTIFSFGQITKNNWMIGGNASFSSLKSSSTASLRYKQTSIQISPIVGYFIKDKFAVGIKPSLIYGSNTIANSSTVFNIGPFIRYYLLNSEKIVNIFSEASYAYGSISDKGQGTKQTSNSFSFSAGPVIYFNSSVGLEFSLMYTSSKINGFDGNNNEIKFGAGFLFYLEKSK